MKGEGILSGDSLLIILCGIAVGTVARIVTIRIDGRQVPSYPSGYLIHLVTGFIASALGAVAIPALMMKDYTAVTFLALAVQNLRDVRKQEQESLEALEGTEFVARGSSYIDGIAKTYEARNYVSLLAALLTVLILTALDIKGTWAILLVSAASGSLLIYLLLQFIMSKRVGDLCDIREGQIQVRDGILYVDDLYVSDQLGTARATDLFLREGVAFVITPRKAKHRLIIEQLGQRKAMLYDAIRTYGVKRLHFTRRSFAKGCVVIAFVPILRDVQGITDTIRATPILESGRKRRYAGKGE